MWVPFYQLHIIVREYLKPIHANGPRRPLWKLLVTARLEGNAASLLTAWMEFQIDKFC